MHQNRTMGLGRGGDGSDRARPVTRGRGQGAAHRLQPSPIRTTRSPVRDLGRQETGEDTKSRTPTASMSRDDGVADLELGSVRRDLAQRRLGPAVGHLLEPTDDIEARKYAEKWGSTLRSCPSARVGQKHLANTTRRAAPFLGIFQASMSSVGSSRWAHSWPQSSLCRSRRTDPSSRSATPSSLDHRRRRSSGSW